MHWHLKGIRSQLRVQSGCWSRGKWFHWSGFGRKADGNEVSGTRGWVLTVFEAHKAEAILALSLGH